MMRSLYSAVSGMAGNMLRMDVIGNNIANINTIGFKAGRVSFQETLGQLQQAGTAPTDINGGTASIHVGTGTLASGVSQLYTQGSLLMTGINTDLAMQGTGLFVLRDGETTLYTRDGSFQVDARGRMIAPGSGHIVQGYEYDQASKTFSTRLSDVYLPIKDVEPAQATTEVDLRGNLDADSQPQGSIMSTSTLYDAAGEMATTATALVDLRQSESGTGELVYDGDTVYVGAVVGGHSVSATLEVSGGTTLDDLATAIEDALNSPENISGITVTVTGDGQLLTETPDQMGTSVGIESLNLSATDPAGEPRSDFSAALAFSELQAARDAGQFVEETTVYDALGFAHTVEFTFTRVQGVNEFTWEAEVDDGTTEILDGGTGRVAFRPDGSLDALVYAATGGPVPTAILFNPGTGAESPVRLELDAGTPGAFDGLTMLRGSPSLESSQNGYSKGSFVRFSVDERGRIMGVFSNSVVRPISQLAIAEFTNPIGLTSTGSNAYMESPNSGSPTIGKSGEGINTTITPGALEQANVDLAKEFTDMIIAQRGFQANARVITSSNEVLSELINMTR